MLQEDKGAWTVTCERCRVVQPLEATSIDEARRAATTAGWLDQARRGKPLAKWTWLCPKCRPQVSGAGPVIGRST